jgi:hypothetical protein
LRLFFWAEPSLPTAREDWFDSLCGTCRPQEVVNKAHADFAENLGTSIYSFLTLYLKRDVYLLGRLAVLLFGQHQQQFGCHPIDSGKSSISSYSSNINQKKLMRGKHVACYSPTHSWPASPLHRAVHQPFPQAVVLVQYTQRTS